MEDEQTDEDELDGLAEVLKDDKIWAEMGDCTRGFRLIAPASSPVGGSACGPPSTAAHTVAWRAEHYEGNQHGDAARSVPCPLCN